MNRMLLGYNPDFDAFDTHTERQPPQRRVPAVFDSVDTMSLAIDLLEVNTAPQLGAVVRRVVRRAGEVLRRPVSGPTLAALSDLLSTAAQHALPNHSSAARANRLNTRARGRFFGLELEGLSPEDQEFETAKAFVRLAGEATRQAALIASQLPPPTTAQVAAARSAQRYAPGWWQVRRSTASNPAVGPGGPPTGAVFTPISRGDRHA